MLSAELTIEFYIATYSTCWLVIIDKPILGQFTVDYGCIVYLLNIWIG